MKKILLGLLISANIFAFNNVTYYGGANAEGNLTIANGSVKDKQAQDYTYTVGMELEKTFRKNRFVSLGFGAKYETAFEAYSKKYGKIDIASTVPLYAMGKFILPLDKNSKLYVKGELGYDFPIEGDYLKKLRTDNPNNSNIKIEGGIYSGVGAGFEVHNFNFELIYNVTRTTVVNPEKISYNYDNAKLSATVGYKFDI